MKPAKSNLCQSLRNLAHAIAEELGMPIEPKPSPPTFEELQSRYPNISTEEMQRLMDSYKE